MGNMAVDGQDTGRMMSKTQHYRKVTKPLLERKRRARMNHYLDELKDLIVETMESQGEHITKLEKADILEMTVTYLREKNQRKSIDNFNSIKNDNSKNDKNTSSKDNCQPPVNAEKFRAGYTQAAYEVSKVFASIPGIDVHFGTKLMKHLGYKLKDLKPPSQSQASGSHQFVTPPQSPNNQKLFQIPPTPPAKIIINELQPNEQQPEGGIGDVWRPW